MGRFYSTSNWTKISKVQLARQPVCQGCEAAAAVIADHVKPIKQGGAMRERANRQNSLFASSWMTRDCRSTGASREQASASLSR
jgi:hypothetical protein